MNAVTTVGHGHSGSDAFASLPRSAEDLGQAIEWLQRHHPQRAERIAVLGHSVGGGEARSGNPGVKRGHRP